MAGKDIFIFIAPLALASISVSQIPSFQTYFLCVFNPILNFVQFLDTGNGEEIFEAKNFVLSTSVFILLHVPQVLVQWMAL